MTAFRHRNRRSAQPLGGLEGTGVDAAEFARASDPTSLGDWAAPGGPVRSAQEADGGGGGGPAAADAQVDAGAGERNHLTGGTTGGGGSQGPEETICVVHPAMFRAHPGKYMLVVALFLGGIAALLTGFIKPDPYAWLSWIGAPLTVAAVIWWVTWWFFSTICVRLTITNKRSIRKEGFIRRSSTEVLHDHVRSVDITQGFVQRMLNVGYIGIDSAGQDGIEIEIRDIPRPYDVKAIIDRYRRM